MESRRFAKENAYTGERAEVAKCLLALGQERGGIIAPQHATSGTEPATDRYRTRHPTQTANSAQSAVRVTMLSVLTRSTVILRRGVPRYRNTTSPMSVSTGARLVAARNVYAARGWASTFSVKIVGVPSSTITVYPTTKTAARSIAQRELVGTGTDHGLREHRRGDDKPPEEPRARDVSCRELPRELRREDRYSSEHQPPAAIERAARHAWLR